MFTIMFAAAQAGNPHLTCADYKRVFSDPLGIAGQNLNYANDGGCCGAPETNPLIGGALGMMFHEQASRNGDNREVVDLDCATTLSGNHAIRMASLFDATDVAITGALCDGIPLHGDRQYVIELKAFKTYTMTKLSLQKIIDVARAEAAASNRTSIIERVELKSNELYVKQFLTAMEGLGGMSDAGYPKFVTGESHDASWTIQALNPTAPDTASPNWGSESIFPGDVRITLRRLDEADYAHLNSLIAAVIPADEIKTYGFQFYSIASVVL